MMWQIIRYVRLQRLSVAYVECHFAPKVFAFFVLLLTASVAYAAGVERITNYQYDGAGNIVDIAIQEQAAPPAVSALSRGFINRANSVQIIATGENLLGAEVLTDVQGLTISNVNPSNNQVTFTLAASAQATLGNASLRFVTGLGEVEQSLIVAQAPPVIITTPNPIVIEGSSVTTAVTLTFAEQRPAQETYTVTITDTDIVTTAQTSFTIGAGQRQATLELTGIGAIGSLTQLELELAEELRFYSFPVTVSRSFLEILAEYPDIQQRSIFSPRVGVVVDQDDSNRSVYSDPVGVVVSSGINLERSVYSSPVGVVVSSDSNINRSVYSDPVSVVVSSDSNINRSVYSGPVGVVVSSDSNINRSVYSDPVGVVVAPLVDDSSQLLAVIPNSSTVLEVRGVNLQTVQSVSVTPNTGLTLGALTSNAVGTVLFVPIDIDAAALGVYEITLIGPQGVIPTSSGLPLRLTVE